MATIKTELITPETAAMWLTKNVSNRRPRVMLVDYLSRQIKSGEWQSDHPQPIVFSDIGRLIDGQHRLMAIVKSGVAVKASVMYGARDSLQEYLDTGISRTLEDRLILHEDRNVNKKICEAVTAWHCIQYGYKGRPSPDQARALFDEHKLALLWVCCSLAKSMGVGRCAVNVALAQYYERDSDKAADFRESLYRPDGHVQQAQMLRDYLVRSPGVGGRELTAHYIGKSICCMKAHLEDREVKVIRVTSW